MEKGPYTGKTISLRRHSSSISHCCPAHPIGSKIETASLRTFEPMTARYVVISNERHDTNDAYSFAAVVLWKNSICFD